MKNMTLKLLFFIFYVTNALENCKTPASGSSDICSICNDNYKIKKDGTCETCKKGETGINNICFKEIKNCLQHKLYIEGIKCIKCEEGYYLNDEETICYKEINNCLSYESNYEKCKKCEKSCTLSKDKTSCVCSDECKISIETNKCTACEGGYYPEEGGESCTPIANCINADDTNKVCTTCVDGAYKSTDGKTCTPVANCLKATDETNKCTQCKPGCWKSDDGSSCTCIPNCIDSYANNKCSTCETGFYLSVDHESCTQISHCTNTKICQQCEAGCYLNSKGVCTCIQGCIFTDDNNLCTACKPGLFLSEDGSSCTMLPECKTVSDDNICTECNPGCFLADDRLSCTCIPYCTQLGTNNICIECKENFAPSEDQKSCEPYYEIPNCIIQEKNKIECKTCKNYYISSENRRDCISCSDDKDSTKCNIALPGCTKVKFSDNRIQCSQCNNGLIATSYNVQCNEDGLYIAKNGNTVATEITNCIEYASEMECSKCLPGNYIIKGNCYTCPTPYVLGDGKNCFLPHFNCADYDDKGKCIKCEEGCVFTSNKQYCIKEGAKDPTNNSYYFNLNIIFLLILILL